MTARGRARVLAGQPWVFRQDVVRGPAGDARQGGPAIVRVVDQRGRPLGLASWAAEARLALRLFQRWSDGDQPAGASLPDCLQLVQQRLPAALERRQPLLGQRDGYRVVHGESDGLPGLFVDRYADALVVQTTSVAMDAALPAIADELHHRLDARIVIERDDGSARDFEGLPRRKGVLAGGGATQVSYRLGENQLTADLMEDSKTGGFLDQADNQAAVAALARPGARALDAFTYHGGFALALGRLGGPVLATDEDERAVARARGNVERNGLPNVTVQRANAFDLLRALEAEGRRFDVVVLDPPALAKRRSESGAADRAYKELVLRGLRLTERGGLLVACSCSGQVSRAHWDDIIAAAAADAGRQAQVLARRGAGADHPELVGVPETAHLKCWILRVL